jgi:hypothetical protein
MNKNLTRWFPILIAILGLVIIPLACMRIVNSYNERHPSEIPPTRTLVIYVEQNQRDNLFERLQQFSENHDLKYHLSFYKDEEIFFVVMDGENFHISALSKPVTTTELEISLFEEDPISPISQKLIDNLFNDLRSLIQEIPNAVILGEK